MKVKVRIAPSPTGNLHIGTAQSALYNWLFARKNGGEFYLRIEDTDRERSTKESEANIIEALTWLGIHWDGEVSRSTDNQKRYQELLGKLLKEGKAFYCHHGQEELETERKAQETAKQPPRHICEHKNSEKGKKSGGVIRLIVDEKSDRIITFDDAIRGRIEFKQALLGDFSIGRAVDDALYHFAVVVDDADMQITHVLRGEDHISNTPKQILIYEALGRPLPQFAHLPLILAPDRSKLSKRHGATAVVDFKKDYLSEALLNFLGSMSHTFSKEILTREEMAEEFDLKKVHKSGAVFNTEKLNWLNSQYIKNLKIEKLRNLVGIKEIPEGALPLITERLEKLTDVGNFDYFWEEPEYDKNLLTWRKSTLEKSMETLAEVKKILEEFHFSAEGGPSSGREKNELRKLLDNFSEKVGDRGLVYWPLRVALTGREKSPDPVEVAFVLEKDIVLQRISVAIKKLD